MKINNSNGWTEVVIKKESSKTDFYFIANLIEHHLDGDFSQKIEKSESNSFDFTYKTKDFTLLFSIYSGISLFPKSLTKSTSFENKKVIEMGESIISLLNSASKSK
jgi:hypothetical protein